MRTVALVPGRFQSNLSSAAARWRAAFRLFTWRSWGVAAIGAAAAVVAIGVPTGMVENSLFGRMTSVRTQDYVIWIATALLMGLVAGTFAVSRATRGAGKATSGGLLSFLATGCPVCNKLVVFLLGINGAFTYFGPLQIYLGIASVGLLLWTLHLRLSAITRSCCAVSPPVEARRGEGT